MEPLDANGASKSDDKQRSVLPEPSMEHPPPPLVAGALGSNVDRTDREFAGMHIGLDDLLPQSSTKESSNPTADPSASVHVAGAEKGNGQISVPVNESALRELKVDRSSTKESSSPASNPPASVHVACAEEGNEQLLVPDDESPQLELQVDLSRTKESSSPACSKKESASPATYPSTPLHVAGAENGNGCLSVPVDESVQQELQVDQSCTKESSSPATNPSSCLVAGAEKGNEQLLVPYDESAQHDLQDDQSSTKEFSSLATDTPSVHVTGEEKGKEQLSVPLDESAQQELKVDKLSTIESSSPATDPSAAVHVAGAKKGKAQLSVPFVESAPPSTSNFRLDEAKEDPLTCPMETDSRPSLEADVVVVAESECCSPTTDPSAAVHLAGGAEKGQEEQRSILVDESARPSTSSNLQLDEVTVASEEDPLTCQASVIPIGGSCLMEIDRSCPSAKLQVYRERHESVPCQPEDDNNITEQENNASDTTPLRRSSRRRLLNANRLVESGEEVFDEETVTEDEGKLETEHVRKRKKTTLEKVKKRRRVDEALMKKEAAVLQRPINLRCWENTICIYIAYNGRWTTNNKYLDHATKLVLVNDEITFEGLLDEILQSLKLKRSECEANIWFDTKLETSKGMLVTNDEEVTTCMYLLKNDPHFKNSRLIVDLVKKDSLSPKSANAESCFDSERRERLTVVEPLRVLEPTTEPEFHTPKGRTEGTGKTSYVTKLKKRWRNRRKDLPIMVLREDASLDEIVVGSLFENKESLKNCFTLNAIKHNFQFKVRRSSTLKWTLKCYGEGCSWRLHASKIRDSECFKIWKFEKNHSCFPEEFKDDQRHVTPKLISDHIIELLRNAKVEITPNFVVAEIRRKYGLSIGYHKAWRSLQRALAIMRGNPELTYLLPPNLETEEVDIGCKELPPGWEKEVVIRKNGDKKRRDTHYTHPEYEYVFRSKKDVFRYLETGDTDYCVTRPVKRSLPSTIEDCSFHLPAISAPADEDCTLMEE